MAFGSLFTPYSITVTSIFSFLTVSRVGAKWVTKVTKGHLVTVCRKWPKKIPKDHQTPPSAAPTTKFWFAARGFGTYDTTHETRSASLYRGV